MRIFPQSKEDWLRFLVLPLKAYVVVAPVLFLVSFQLPRPLHSGATDAEALLVVSLFPCSLALFLAALLFALTGPKGFALPCAAFGLAAFAIGFFLLPGLATT